MVLCAAPSFHLQKLWPPGCQGWWEESALDVKPTPTSIQNKANFPCLFIGFWAFEEPDPTFSNITLPLPNLTDEGSKVKTLNYSSALWDKMGKVIVLRQKGERKKWEEWVVSSVQPHSWKWWWRARELRLADNQKDFRVGKPDLCFYIACHMMHGVLLPKCLMWIGMLCRYGGRDWALRVSWKDLEEITHTERWTKIRGTKATFTLSQKFIESMRICGIL